MKRVHAVISLGFLFILGLILEKPQITTTNTVKEKAGKKLVLEALVTGKPSPKVTWFKDGLQIVSGDDCIQHHSGNTYSLTIVDCSPTHAGKYTVSAENNSGKIQQDIKVVVMGMFLFL